MVSFESGKSIQDVDLAGVQPDQITHPLPQVVLTSRSMWQGCLRSQHCVLNAGKDATALQLHPICQWRT